MKALLVGLCSLLCSACGGAAQHADTAARSGVNADTPEAQFKHLLASHIKASENHFWDVIDCETRDEGTGMPTHTLRLPGATRAFIDASEYTAHNVFPQEGLGKSDLHAFVHQQLKTSLPDGYAYEAFDDAPGAAVRHATSPDDFVSIELTMMGDLLYMSFHPAANRDIPWGNPCMRGAPPAP